LIQFVVAVYAITVDVEHRPSLVSADPNVFLAEVSMVAGQSFLTVSNDYRPKADRSVQGDLSAAPLDDVVALVFYVAYFAALGVWTLVIAPLQCLGNLVVGAPVRLALTSPLRRYEVRRGNVTHINVGEKTCFAEREDRRRRDANRAEQKPGPVAIRPTTYGHPGAWKAFSKAGFCCPPWLTDVG